MDRITRQAVRWATAVSLPLVALVAGSAFFVVGADEPTAEPTISAPAPHVNSTTPVAVPAPRLPQRVATVCRALLSQVPADIHGLPRRPVTAGPKQNTAYGEPAITLACGAPAPSIRPTDLVFPLNQVCRHAVDRPFSGAVTAAVPSLRRIPGGCRS